MWFLWKIQLFLIRSINQKAKKEKSRFWGIVSATHERKCRVLITGSNASVFSRSTFNRSLFSPLSRTDPSHGIVFPRFPVAPSPPPPPSPAAKFPTVWISRTRSVSLYNVPFRFFFPSCAGEATKKRNNFLKVGVPLPYNIVLGDNLHIRTRAHVCKEEGRRERKALEYICITKCALYITRKYHILSSHLFLKYTYGIFIY